MNETIATIGNGTTLDDASHTSVARGANTRDPELVALTRIFSLLDGLAAPSRARVVRYIAEKYESDLE